jgi:hypothetical protein
MVCEYSTSQDLRIIRKSMCCSFPNADTTIAQIIVSAACCKEHMVQYANSEISAAAVVFFLFQRLLHVRPMIRQSIGWDLGRVFYLIPPNYKDARFRWVCCCGFAWGGSARVCVADPLIDPDWIGNAGGGANAWQRQVTAALAASRLLELGTCG